MRLINCALVTLLMLMLSSCSGAYVSIPIGPVTIGTDVSMFGESSRDGLDESEPDENEHQDERE